MGLEKSFYPLAEVVERTGLKAADLLHLATQSKVSLVVGVPEGISLKVYDTLHEETYDPFLLTPSVLLIKPTYCPLIALNGRTSQCDFVSGYLIKSNGELQALFPSYGYPHLIKDRLVWRAYQGEQISKIGISGDQLFLMHEDLKKLEEGSSFRRSGRGKVRNHDLVSENRDSNETVEEGRMNHGAASATGLKVEILAAHKSARANVPSDTTLSKANNQPAKVLRLKEVIKRTGLSRSTIYDKMNERSPRYEIEFPRSIRLGKSSVGWLEAEVEKWLESRVRVGRGLDR